MCSRASFEVDPTSVGGEEDFWTRRPEVLVASPRPRRTLSLLSGFCLPWVLLKTKLVLMTFSPEPGTVVVSPGLSLVKDVALGAETVDYLSCVTF